MKNMNVVREDVDALNAILKVEVKPEDYQAKVKTTLENHRKKAKMPGFRPGHVPLSLIKKQYGKSVLAEEMNKIVNENLYKFIQDEKLDILGNPIPKKDAEVKGDFDNPNTFEFQYEIGLRPDFKVPLSAKNKYDYVKVKVDDKLINKQIDDLRRRYGKLVGSEKVGESDLILGQFVELNKDESIKEGGVLHSSTISMEFINDKKVKKAILGSKVGDKHIVNPEKVSKGGKDTAAMLGIEEEELETIFNKFQLTINEIKQMELAELNKELFDKLFGEGNVKSEGELKERVTSDLQNMFATDSDKLLTKNIYEDLLKKVKMDLPDTFLKRWIQMSNEKPITDEQIEEDYDNYRKSLKWQLIQGNIFKENDIKIDQEEALAYTKQLLVNNYAQYGMPAPEDEELTKSAMQVMQNQEEANRIYDMLAETKLTTFFKNTVKLKEKEISYDEFTKLASK